MTETVNVSGMNKPQSAAAAIRQAHEYIRTMKALKKPVDHVALRASDYDAILRSVNKGREQPVAGIRIDEVRIDRGSR